MKLFEKTYEQVCWGDYILAGLAGIIIFILVLIGLAQAHLLTITLF